MLVWGWALEQDHQRQAANRDSMRRRMSKDGVCITANRDSMRRRMSKDGVCITANIFILVRIFFFFNLIKIFVGNLFIYTLCLNAVT
jgi:hypothetical protein